MYFNIDRRFGLHTIHKCASTALQNSLPRSGLWFSQIDINAYMRMSHRVVFIRDPFKRAESAYRMYCRNGCSFRHDLTSFDAFIASICKPQRDDKNNIQSDGLKDLHTMPQLTHIVRHGWSPTEICRWDFARIAELYGIPEIKPENVSYKGNNPDYRIDVEWSDGARDTFERWYAGDIALWEGKIECGVTGPRDPEGFIDRELKR